ncbi:MAG: dockerin type I repeat-containing protein [Spirochaetales bacterium]|nr:dockerin type I repeat-containing protein [Spirochaetales bacterium]
MNIKKMLLLSVVLTLIFSSAFTQSPGDVNNDGNIDIVDALLIARYYVGLPVSDFNSNVADVDCNDTIDIVDALLVAQYYVGLINEMPCMPVSVSPEVSVLYVMHYLSPETSTDTTLNDLKGSGFDTCIIFSIDGTSEGNFTFFGTPVFTDGNYVGPAGWPDKIRSLKTGSTSIKRLAFCLAGPYGTYKTYMNTYGTGPETAWYRNFAKLKELTGADAVDFNDENSYDVDAMVKLGRMLDNIGYKVTLCPYNNTSVWISVKSQLGDIVDAVNLQCYDGGRYNNVGTWNTYFGGLKVTPLFWTLHADGTGDTYSTAETKVRDWKNSYGIISAGAWQYSDMRDYGGGTAARFNAAIRNGLQ